MDTFYFGHPLIEAISSHKINNRFFSDNNIPNNKPVIAFLPGSRTQEIKTMLPIFLSIISDYPNYNFVIAGVNNVDPKLYNLAAYSNLYIIYNLSICVRFYSKYSEKLVIVTFQILEFNSGVNLSNY